jgi:hypothetical protein
MDRNCIYIIIFVLLILFIFIKISNRRKFEHLTNDEAVKNVASLYNTDQLTATNLIATGSTTTPKLQLGNKWVLSGVAGTDGNNDGWLRLLGANGQYYGGLAAGQLWVGGAYNSDVAGALNDLNNRLNAANAATESLTARVAAIESGYVKKGPINLVASYSNAYGNARTNNPVMISENYYLRSWPTTDATAINLASQLAIL